MPAAFFKKVFPINGRYFACFQGEQSFFLRPGEKLESGIQNLYVLGDDEGLILRANEEFVQDNKVWLCVAHV